MEGCKWIATGTNRVEPDMRYHVIAPDLPGLGFSEAPDRERKVQC
jgi:pimeloyl-ACP methyl ester carboxylesterase